MIIWHNVCPIENVTTYITSCWDCQCVPMCSGQVRRHAFYQREKWRGGHNNTEINRFLSPGSLTQDFLIGHRETYKRLTEDKNILWPSLFFFPLKSDTLSTFFALRLYHFIYESNIFDILFHLNAVYSYFLSSSVVMSFFSCTLFPALLKNIFFMCISVSARNLWNNICKNLIVYP